MNDSMPTTEELEVKYEAFVRGLADAVLERLEEYDLFISEIEIIPAIMGWAVNRSREEAVPLNEFVLAHVEQVGELAEEVTNVLLLSLAEERPGTDPWEAEEIIPIPVSVALMISHSLAASSSLAFSNGAEQWGRSAVVTVGQLSCSLAELFLHKNHREGEMQVLSRVGKALIPIRGPIVSLPQPAVAHMARFLEAVALKLSLGEWTSADQPRLDDSDIDDVEFSTVIAHEAALLRDLNARHGRSSEPRAWS